MTHEYLVNKTTTKNNNKKQPQNRYINPHMLYLSVHSKCT